MYRNGVLYQILKHHRQISQPQKIKGVLYSLLPSLKKNQGKVYNDLQYTWYNSRNFDEQGHNQFQLFVSPRNVLIVLLQRG